MEFYVPGAAESKWCNPFPVKKHGLEKCLELYKSWIKTGVNEISKKSRKDGALICEISELDGKTLGCWCKPDTCHGDVLVEMMEQH